MSAVNEIRELLAGINPTIITPDMKTERISTGSIAMDLYLGGGWAQGRINAISGRPGTGKTTIVLQTIARYLQSQTERIAVWIDTENRIDPEWAEQQGVDISRLVIIGTFSTKGERLGQEAVLKIATKVITGSSAGIVVLDSLAAMKPQQVGGDPKDPEFGKAVMGVRAKNNDDFFSVISGSLRQRNVTLIVINQLRDSMNPQGDPFVEPGGVAKDYSYTLAVRLHQPEVYLDSEKEVSGYGFKGKLRKSSVKRGVGSDFLARYRLTEDGSLFPDIAAELPGIGEYYGIFTDDAGQPHKRGTWHFQGQPLMLNDKKVNSAADCGLLMETDPELRAEVLEELANRRNNA